jgi:Ca-activated chloride channel family protein
MDRLEKGVVKVLSPWFANPWAFWILAGLPLLAGLGLLAIRRQRRLRAQVGNEAAVGALIVRPSKKGVVRGLCVFAGLALLSLGIAGPQWGRDREQVISSGGDLVVLLDLSRSMLAQDVLPSRLEKAKLALADLSDRLQKRGGHRVALVVFAARAKTVCPLTRDYDHFRLAVVQQSVAGLPSELRPRAGGPTSGTRMGAGLRMAVKAAGADGEGPRMILMLSDGDDPARDEEWREGALGAEKRHLPVVVVGLGDPEPKVPIRIPLGNDFLQHAGQPVQTRLEEKPLEEIARLTHGTYLRAGSGSLDLGTVLRDWLEPRGASAQAADRLPAYRQRYPWFFGAAFAFFAAALVISNPRSPRPRVIPPLSGPFLAGCPGEKLVPRKRPQAVPAGLD